MENLEMLPERQQVLYEYLLGEYNQSEVFSVRAKKIIRDLCDYYIYDPDKGENSSGLRMLRKDVDQINDSFFVERIIISDRWGYKIANKAEYLEWREKKRASIIKRLAKLSIKDKKAALNNQIKLIVDENDINQEVVKAFEKGN